MLLKLMKLQRIDCSMSYIRNLKKENNGKVNIRKIEDNHIVETVEKY